MTTPTDPADQTPLPPDAVPEMPATDEARAAAPGGWFTCKVDRAGPVGDQNHVALRLRDGTGKVDAYYGAALNMQREVLATALAALTSNKTVIVRLTATGADGVITALYATG